MTLAGAAQRSEPDHDRSVGKVLALAVERGEVPGVAAFAADRRGPVFEGAWGRRNGHGEAMTVDSVFWLASLTKAVTTVAALQLVERGRLGLDEPLRPLFPQLARLEVLEGYDENGRPKLRPARGDVTPRNLMSHTAGFGYHYWNADLLRFYEESGGIADSPRRILDGPLASDPGSRWNYGVSTDWLGQVVEKVADEDLESYFRGHILDPLGMSSTSFLPSVDMRARLVEMSARGADGRLGPMAFEPHQRRDFLSGGGGLFGSGEDYLRFTRALLGEGALDGVRILRPDTVRQMRENQIGGLLVQKLKSALPRFSNDVDLLPGIAKRWGLGFMLNERTTPTGRSAGSLAWAGLANTYFWIDPRRGVTGVLLTQILPFADPSALQLLDRFETAVYRSR